MGSFPILFFCPSYIMSDLGPRKVFSFPHSTFWPPQLPGPRFGSGRGIFPSILFPQISCLSRMLASTHRTPYPNTLPKNSGFPSCVEPPALARIFPPQFRFDAALGLLDPGSSSDVSVRDLAVSNCESRVSELPADTTHYRLFFFLEIELFPFNLYRRSFLTRIL